MSGRRHNEIDSSLQPGSPQPGEPVYLMIGRLRRPHGVNGELLLELTTEHPEKVKPGLGVYIGENKTPLKIARIRAANKLWLVSFEGYDQIQQVEWFTNQWVYISDKDAAPLPEGRYYHHEIIGMQVFSDQGELLGVVSEIIVTGANDVYVVKSESGTEILLPAIKSVIIEIDREAHRIVARQQEWW